MNTITISFLQRTMALGCFAVLLSAARAQEPAEKPANDAGNRQLKNYASSSVVTRMMAFDKNKDGKLTKDEVTDVRLHRLFDRADANKDGVVTREELMALAATMEAEIGPGRGPGGFGGPGDEGPGGRGPGGPGGGGPGGPGFRGMGGPPRPGMVLPPFLAAALNLTSSQREQVEKLQKEVDAKISAILTDEQKEELKQMRFNPGPPGGPGGRGGPGGGRPGGRDRPE